MSHSESTIQAAKNVLDPYLRASKAWVAEVEKFQQTTIENMSRAVDEGYKLAKESINNMASFQENFRKQWQAQLDKASEMMSSFIP